MKRLILSVLVVFAIAAVVVGCKSSGTPAGSTELQGKWALTVFGETVAFTFNVNNWTLTDTNTSGTTQLAAGTFTIDSTANPKTIDMYFTSDPGDDQSMVGTTVKGIYQITGNNLMIAMADTASDPRPTELNESNSMPLTKQ